MIKSHWDSIVKKRDFIYVLGDSAFNEEGIDWIANLLGTKYLIRGNHCTMPTTSYLRAFKEVYGLLKYKGIWLSHAPIHPQELRGNFNAHGHTHYHNISNEETGEDDTRYLNCCVENLMHHLGRPLIELSEVKNYFNTGCYEKLIYKGKI